MQIFQGDLRVDVSALLLAQQAAIAAGAAAADAEKLRLPPYQPFSSRLAAQAADIQPDIEYLTVGDLRYVRDPAGTALTTADGANWSPLGPASAEHYGAIGDGVANDTVPMTRFLSEAVGTATLTPGARYSITSAITLINPNFTGIHGDGSSELVFSGAGKLNVSGTITELPGLAAGWTVSNKQEIRLAAAPGVTINVGDVIILWNPTDFSFGTERDYYRDGCMAQVNKVTGTSIFVYGAIPRLNESAMRVFHMPRRPFTLNGFSYTAGTALPTIRLQHFVGIDVSEVGSPDIGADLGIMIDKSFDIEIRSPRNSAVSGNAYPIQISNCQNYRIFGGSMRSSRHAIGLGGNGFEASVPCRDGLIHGVSLFNNPLDAPAQTGAADVHGNVIGIRYQSCTIHNGVTLSGRDMRFEDCDIKSMMGPDRGMLGYSGYVGGGVLEFSRCRFVINRNEVGTTPGMLNLGVGSLAEDLTLVLKDIRLEINDTTGNAVLPLVYIQPNKTQKAIHIIVDGITAAQGSGVHGSMLSLINDAGIPTTNDNVRVSIRNIAPGIYTSYAGGSASGLDGTKYRIDGWAGRVSTPLVSGSNTSFVTTPHVMSYPKTATVWAQARNVPGGMNYWHTGGGASFTHAHVYSFLLTGSNTTTGDMAIELHTSLREF